MLRGRGETYTGDRNSVMKIKKKKNNFLMLLLQVSNLIHKQRSIAIKMATTVWIPGVHTLSTILYCIVLYWIPGVHILYYLYCTVLYANWQCIEWTMDHLYGYNESLHDE